MGDRNLAYKASPTCWKFHNDDSFVKGLLGPIGSGKSVACCADLMKRATEQEKSNDGRSYSRWAIIRNTYRELHDTTMRTFFDWFPKDLGKWRTADMEWTLSNKDMQAEFIFRALDRPDDIKKLLSLELTGAWINEGREIPKPVLDMLQGRVGRYPALKDGVAPTWSGIILDTNPPDTDHWWYRMFEEEHPDGWALFKQPSGLAPNAENLENLPHDYYTRLQSGHDQEWINVYVHGKYGFIQDGKPMYPEYNDSIHAAPQPLEYNPHNPIWLGIDFGLTPAAAMAQQQPDGSWHFIDELVTEDMGAVGFGKLLYQRIQSQYPGAEIHAFGDPSGDNRSQVDERTPFDALQASGIHALPTDTNDPLIRHEAMASLMTRLTTTGKPAFILSPKCKMLRKGLAGGYKRRRLQVAGTSEMYKDAPEKNIYSHVCEAAEYLCLGAGLGGEVMGNSYNAQEWDGVLDYTDKAAI
ncbi:MAG: hypothetical protein GY765_14305 [bacterium]|nr:hypothetical protein [bacterium]